MSDDRIDSSDAKDAPPEQLPGRGLDVQALRRVAYLAASSRGLRPADADDVAQHAILRLMMVQHRVQSPAGWVRIVAQRTSAALVRTGERWRSLEDICSPTDARWPTGGAAPGPAFDLLLDIDRALRKLPATFREVWLEHFLERYSLDELTARTGLSRSTLIRRIRRSRRRLRAALVVH